MEEVVPSQETVLTKGILSVEEIAPREEALRVEEVTLDE